MGASAAFTRHLPASLRRFLRGTRFSLIAGRRGSLSWACPVLVRDVPFWAFFGSGCMGLDGLSALLGGRRASGAHPWGEGRRRESLLGGKAGDIGPAPLVTC